MSIQEVICGDSLEVVKTLDLGAISCVITDPPYPDYFVEEYGYKEGIIDFLKDIPCRQLIFWSAKVPFPLDYTAIHIWHKPNGAACQYERIFERNGGKRYRVFRALRIQSVVSADMAHDVFNEHESQKPLSLMKELVADYSNEGETILDPFMGSGTTLVAAKYLNRNATGIEISPKYCEIAKNRLAQEQLF